MSSSERPRSPARAVGTRSAQGWRQQRNERAYLQPDVDDDVEAVCAELAATRALLRATSPEDVAHIVRTLVHDLGGGLVPARLASGPGAVPLDVSLGLDEPLLPLCDPTSVARLRLAQVLPPFVEQAKELLPGLRAPSAPAVRKDPGLLPTIDLSVWRERFANAAAQADQHVAAELVLTLHERGVPAQEIVRQVLAPVQVEVGQRWEDGSWGIADEHAASFVCESAAAVLAAEQPPASAHDRHVLLACAEGEWHSLPARLAAVAVTQGIRITVLGPAVSAEALRRRLAAGDVDLLALSCTVTTNLPGAARCIDAAHQAGVPVLVGGQAFGTTPARAVALDADAWGRDAAALLDPVSLADRGPVVRHPEVDRLGTLDRAALTLAHERLLAAFPALLPGRQRRPTELHDDLHHLARAAAAALLTRDPSVLHEAVRAVRRWQGADVPNALLATGLLLVAEAVEADAPQGAALLRAAAHG